MTNTLIAGAISGPTQLSFHSAEDSPTEFRTARSPSEVHSTFSTAEVCTTQASTDSETCEVCRSEVSMDYGTAECRCGQKARSIVMTESEVEVEKSIEVETLEPEPEPVEEVERFISPPLEVPTISDEIGPEDIPLPGFEEPYLNAFYPEWWVRSLYFASNIRGIHLLSPK
jgi:hypothetical protein